MAGDEIAYVIPVARVREAVETLLHRETHPFFAAYLYLRRLAGQRGSLTGLTPHWPDLGAVLEVDGGPVGKPYLRPFWKGTRQSGQEWLNKNLAGSFAPSSLRVRGTPQEVIEVDAAGRFNLRPDHSARALQALLFGQRMPALALAGFVFRDRAILALSAPSSDDLIALFRQQYGYDATADEEFNLLYDVAWHGVGGAWFEPFNQSAGGDT